MTGKIDPTAWEGHTPGPWAVSATDVENGAAAIDAEGAGCWALARVIVVFEGEQSLEGRANAALCAAAPDLAARVAELEAERDELIAAARSVDGQEAHRILPAVWPIIQRMAKGDPA